jgi:hypothetical protein
MSDAAPGPQPRWSTAKCVAFRWVRPRKIDESKFTLVGRGCHWIDE